MGLNCTFDWEKEKRIDDDLRDGRYIFVGKAKPVKYVGTVADVLKEKREKEFQRLLKKIKQNSVDVEVAVTKAVAKTLPLRSERIEVVKSAENVRKLPVSELLPRIALHGGNMNVLLSWKTLRGLVVDAAGSS
jgi:hypothetical protein